MNNELITLKAFHLIIEYMDAITILAVYNIFGFECAVIVGLMLIASNQNKHR